MQIHKNFVGGNVRVEKIDGNLVCLNNELRDTTEDWFYWAFCVENACGQTVTFKFPPVRLGYYGPAVSHDLKTWNWLGKGEQNDSFTYTFGENENKVYFAHSMLYHPQRFLDFAAQNGIEVSELCKSRKGRSVPYAVFGSGERVVFLTARHHACESTGSYVLEGVLETLIKSPVENTKIVCVPFVDYDGVVDGDQGKARAPYDHARDYDPDKPCLYPETAAVRKLSENGVYLGFDFHSPWHCSGQNDTVFAVLKRTEKIDEFKKFGSILKSKITADSMKYDPENDVLPGVGWNKANAPTFANFMMTKARAKLSFTLETAYFGTPDNVFSQSASLALGHCFAEAIREYAL